MGITSTYAIKLLFCTVNKTLFFMISGFRREVAENCALLGYYTAISGKLHYSLRNNPEERSP